MRILIRLEGKLNFYQTDNERINFGQLWEMMNLSPFSSLLYVQNGTNRDDTEKVDSFGIVEVSQLDLGGKGGFGSLLKGQPPVKKRTNNFDSCRDLTGRRVRHVNQDRLLREWEQKKIEEEKLIKLYNDEDKTDEKSALVEEKKKEIHQKNKEFIEDFLDSMKSVSNSIKFLSRKNKREHPPQEKQKEPKKHLDLNVNYDDMNETELELQLFEA